MEANGKQVHVDSMDEEIVARVAAIDVANDAGVVCMRVPHPSQLGRRTTTVRSVSARTSAIIAVVDRLAEEHVERVVLDRGHLGLSRPFYYLLEARGLVVWVVTARDVRNVPGRSKTDLLTELPELDSPEGVRLPVEMASCIPPVEIRQLRDYTQPRVDLTTEQSRHIQRLERLLEDAYRLNYRRGFAVERIDPSSPWLRFRFLTEIADAPRDLSSLVVSQRGFLDASDDLFEPFRLVDASGRVLEPVSAYLRGAAGVWPFGFHATFVRDGSSSLVSFLCEPPRSAGIRRLVLRPVTSVHGFRSVTSPSGRTGDAPVRMCSRHRHGPKLFAARRREGRTR
jgi:hypothetical protein